MAAVVPLGLKLLFVRFVIIEVVNFPLRAEKCPRARTCIYKLVALSCQEIFLRADRTTHVMRESSTLVVLIQTGFYLLILKFPSHFFALERTRAASSGIKVQVGYELSTVKAVDCVARQGFS